MRRLGDEGAERDRRAARLGAGGPGRPARRPRAVRAPARAAGRGGGAHVLGGVAGRGWPRRRAAPLAPALSALQEKDILAPEAESRLAGERELAFKHVLIRDVAYGMLPKAVRWRKHFEVGRFIEERAGDRTDEVVALLAEHYGRAAALGAEAGGEPERAGRGRRARRALPRGGRGRRGAPVRQPRGDRALRPGAGPACGTPTRRRRRASARSRATSRCGWGAWTRRWRSGSACLEPPPRARRTSSAMADLHRKLGAALAVKGERKAAIENYQRGHQPAQGRAARGSSWCTSTRRPPGCTSRRATTCWRSTPPRRRCAWPSGWARPRAASRAHGIFGRVFGRIGDNEKARMNLERSVELARGLGPGRDDRGAAGPGPPLRAVAGRRARRRGRLPRGAGAGRAGRRPAQPGRAARRGGPARRLPGGLGPGAAVHRRQHRAGRARGPRVQAVPALRAARACCRWRDGELDRAEQRFREAHALAEQVGWSELSFQSLYGLALVLRDRGDLRRRRDGAGRGRRRLRAGRPGRPVGAGDGHARGGAGAGRARPAGARVGRRGRGPGRAA